MKKLIAILVVFALVAGSAFAIDLGGTVIGSIVPLTGTTADGDDDVMGFGVMNRWRLQGSGSNEDDTFGVWMRFERTWWDDGLSVEGLAWWKPIDQLKVSIGGNSDGIFGKEGFAGWMFHQIPADTSVVKGSQAWGCDYTLGLIFRDAFFGGFADQGLLLEITPMDMLAVNLAVPFISMTGAPWEAAKTEDIFKYTTAQVDLNLDFGNIAFTYVGGLNEFTGPDEVDASKIFVYFGLSSVENLDLGVSIGYTLPVSEDKLTVNSPIAAGLAAKYTVNDEFAIKARTVAAFAGNIDFDGDKVDMPFQLIFEVNPSYNLTESVTIFADIGINFVGEAKDMGIEDSVLGWHFNPYIGIGSEWGPRFFVGVNLFSTGEKDGKGNEFINWEIPLALVVSF